MEEKTKNGVVDDTGPGGDTTDAFGFNVASRASYRNAAGEPMDTESTSIQDDPFVYNFMNPRRGKAIIINNRDFHPMLGMPKRNGTDVDARNLHEKWQSLGFDVYQHDNLPKKQMLQVVRTAGLSDHSDADCFVLCVLSHGEEGGVLYAYDGQVNVDELTAPFAGDLCPSLVGKPKLFFLQACRGTKLDHGADRTDAEAEPGEDFIDAQTTQKIPVMADFLMAYSVVPGYYSWRNSENGSWFVQALCQVLKRHGTDMEILHILTRVNYIVAHEFESNAARASMNKKKQIPSIVSMLTKQLYFRPKSNTRT